VSKVGDFLRKVKKAVKSVGPAIQGNNYGSGYNIGGKTYTATGPAKTGGGSEGGDGGGSRGITVVSPSSGGRSSGRGGGRSSGRGGGSSKSPTGSIQETLRDSEIQTRDQEFMKLQEETPMVKEQEK